MPLHKTLFCNQAYPGEMGQPGGLIATTTLRLPLVDLA